MNVPKRVSDRLSKTLRGYQRVLQSARDRDVNESDTVTIVKDVLAEVFGFDKYADITSEQAIRGTFCDLAVKLEGDIKYLIEVKAIGLTLKENHLRQAVNYGANHGIPWVVLTNGVNWEIYRIKFERPIDFDVVTCFDLLELNPRKAEDQGKLFLLCKEGLGKKAIEEFHEHVQVVNRFVLAAIIRSAPVLEVIRRELKRLPPAVKTTKEELASLLGDVLKRDVIEGKAAQKAAAQVRKCSGKALKKKRGQPGATSTEPGGPTPQEHEVGSDEGRLGV